MDLSDILKEEGAISSSFDETYPPEKWEPSIRELFCDWSSPHVCPDGVTKKAQPAKKRAKQPEFQFDFDANGLPILTDYEDGARMTSSRQYSILRSFLTIHWCR